MVRKTYRKKKLGLALGAGSAKGLCHIGILRSLENHGIYPDYLAGTSMGAVIAAAYAAGRPLDEIEKIAKDTDWKTMVDFMVPKVGLLRGRLIERKLAHIFGNKTFDDLDIPLRIVSYNLGSRKRVIFEKGGLAKAVRASISIPGIFAPMKIGKNYYIDGAVSDPTPFDVVEEMGSDVVIAVDLYSKEKTKKVTAVNDLSFLSEMKKRFFIEQLNLLKNVLFPERWPGFIRKILNWIFDKILYPARILRMIVGKEPFPITKVMTEAVNILTNNLARERIKNADIDIKITPDFGRLQWADFDKIEKFIIIGEKAMDRKIPLLKKKLGL